MNNHNNDAKGLAFQRISDKHSAVIDADNVFWAIHKNNAGLEPIISKETLALYARVKERLNREMSDFRFSAELSAIYLDPTDRCNADCPYCYVPRATRKNGREMTRQQLAYVLEKILAYFKGKKRKPVVIFHASEPLLVKESIFEAIKAYKDKFNFGLQTNGILLKESDVEFLKEHRVGVGISLDSSSPSVNNLTRPASGTGGNFRQAVRAIEWFDGYEGLNVIATVTRINLSGLPGLVKFLHQKKVPCVLLNPVRLTQSQSRGLKPDEKLFTKYFLRAVDQALRLSRKSSRRIIIGNFTNVIIGIIAPSARRMMCDISPCGGGRCFLTITAKGEMIPCGEFIGLKGSSGGNIFRTGIKEAMRSRPFKEIRSRIVEKIEECKSCIFRNICGAPCPAELKALGGIYQKAVFCEFYKAIINYAFKLIARGREKYCLREGALDELQYQYRLF
jgi:uncharacterized protein